MASVSRDAIFHNLCSVTTARNILSACHRCLVNTFGGFVLVINLTSNLLASHLTFCFRVVFDFGGCLFWKFLDADFFLKMHCLFSLFCPFIPCAVDLSGEEIGKKKEGELMHYKVKGTGKTAVKNLD